MKNKLFNKSLILTLLSLTIVGNLNCTTYAGTGEKNQESQFVFSKQFPDNAEPESISSIKNRIKILLMYKHSSNWNQLKTTHKENDIDIKPKGMPYENELKKITYRLNVLIRQLYAELQKYPNPPTQEEFNENLKELKPKVSIAFCSFDYKFDHIKNSQFSLKQKPLQLSQEYIVKN